MAEPIEINVVGGRLQTPPDKDGNRKDIHFTTNAEAVVYNDEQTVADKLREIGNGVAIQKEVPDHSCLWIEPVDDPEPTPSE